MDYSGNGYNATNNGADRVTTIGTNQAMYYDASGSDYIRTNSFAIPNTGVLTVEAWMKSVLYGGLIGESSLNGALGTI